MAVSTPRRTSPHAPSLLAMLLVGIWLGAPCLSSAFSHFEARHCHPIEHTSDGLHMLAVNAPEGRLSVFASGPDNEVPLLIAEIPVGLEPVSVRARTSNEIWVVNEVSDSVSIVDLELGRVVATLPAGDEPADVLFAAGRAFVTSARENRILVFDPAARHQVGEIPLQGNFPRHLAHSPDQSKIYAAFLFGGNQTTTLHRNHAPEPPLPPDAALPPAPQTALIVHHSDPGIPYEVLDHDIVEIDAHTLAVTAYNGGIGTNVHAISIAPDGSLWAAATEAHNLIRFEPELNGIFQESRVALIVGNDKKIFDLNPHATQPVIEETEKQLSLAQPMAILADETGAWIAAFGSDRLARIAHNGQITQRIDLRHIDPITVRGPRGISKNPSRPYLAIHNKLSNTISLISTETHSIVGEIPISSHQPIPQDHQTGRGFFNDSRLSGNGTVSCASCHFDADIDGIAWDLGNPSGPMVTKIGFDLSLDETEPVDRVMHPMKGPMVTQSLRGIKDAGPFHWRGDRDTIHEFNSSFSQLQAGSDLDPAEMDMVVAYIESLRNHPNPNRQIDNSLPPTINGADPFLGEWHFNNVNVCSSCHVGPRGTNHVLDAFSSVLSRQPLKNSTLEHTYKKLNYTPHEPTTISGYGFSHDGTGNNIPRGHEYAMDEFSPAAEAHVMAFILCAETDTKPSVGRISKEPCDVLHATAAANHCDIVAHATIHSTTRSYLYDPKSGKYLPSSSALPPLTPDDLSATATSLFIFTVPPGNGPRFSIDRSGDGTLNDDAPPPVLKLSSDLEPIYPSPVPDWVLESSKNLRDWHPHQSTAEEPPTQFFRLRRTW